MVNKVQTTFHTTPAERELLRTMAGKNVSAFLRVLIRDEAARRGLPLPDETLDDTRGKYARG